MNIVLLGANGQLGRSFLLDGRLAALGELVPATRDGRLGNGGTAAVADLSAPRTLSALLERVRPDIIVNTAAYTAVDRAEQEEDLATRINGEAVATIAEWAARQDTLVVHYSTDYVFDGRAQQPYPIDAPTSPLGAYGRSKLAGEQALRASGAGHFLFRTAWVYAPHGQNFLRTMLRLGGEREELRVVADQHGSPTSTQLIVDGTIVALKRWLEEPPSKREALEGTHHLVASGVTTWHGFASAIFDHAGNYGLLPRKPTVQAIETAEFPTPAKRPAYSVLDNNGFQEKFGFLLPHWREGLADAFKLLSQER